MLLCLCFAVEIFGIKDYFVYIFINLFISMSNTEVIKALKDVLYESYILLLKTQNYHWNVTGQNFYSLHTMFQQQYEDLFIAIDLIAERIRTLGDIVPARFETYLKFANIKEGEENSESSQMVKNLAHDQDLISKTLYKALKLAQEISDEATVNIITDRIQVHQKNAWMLKSSL
jgi:starvation-inducible DNA-binding protein